MKRRFKFIFAAFIVLLAFAISVIPSSAAGASSDSTVIDYIIGTPFTVGLVYDSYSTVGSHVSAFSTFSPIFTEPSLGTYSNTFQQEDSVRLDDFYSYYRFFYLGNYNFNDSYVPEGFDDTNPFTYDERGNFSGVASLLNGSVSISPNNENFPYINDFFYLRLSSQDFSCWIDADGYLGSEIFFRPNYSSSNHSIYINSIEVNYSVYGSDQVFHTSLDTSLFPDIGDQQYLYVTPDLLGYTDPNTYIFIHDFDLYFSASVSGTLYQNSIDFYFDVGYVFNPLLFDYSYGGHEPDNGSFNPAVPLLSYTDFLATAGSGFLDLELFPNFTLGGIFMTVLAFVCVVWFLKLVAGG